MELVDLLILKTNFQDQIQLTASGSATWAQIDFDQSFSQSAVDGAVTFITVARSLMSELVDLKGVKGFIAESGSHAIYANSGSQLMQFTSASDTDVTFFFNTTASLAAADSPFEAYFEYQKQPRNAAERGDFEAGNRSWFNFNS